MMSRGNGFFEAEVRKLGHFLFEQYPDAVGKWGGPFASPCEVAIKILAEAKAGTAEGGREELLSACKLAMGYWNRSAECPECEASERVCEECGNLESAAYLLMEQALAKAE